MTSQRTSPSLPKARGHKQLMSQLLTSARHYIELAEQSDVASLRHFLLTHPERPLITLGHGGSFASASYAALLYGTNCGVGKAVTSYLANSLSDATLQNSKLMLVSKSLKNIDAKHIYQRMQHVNPSFSCHLSLPSEAGDLSEGFISIHSTFMFFSMLYKAFTGDADFSRLLALSPDAVCNYTYRCVDGAVTPPDLSTISRFTVLYGSYGEPVAHKLESNMTEAGLASCVISDFRDECHGRFLSLSNFISSRRHPQTDCALVLLVTPREEGVCRQLLKCLPAHLPVVIIRTVIDTPLASIDLLYKMSMFTADYGEKYCLSNPNDPNNLGGIDKRAFRDHVSFREDFRHYGPLSLSASEALQKKCA